jgi:hypothetical protein
MMQSSRQYSYTVFHHLNEIDLNATEITDHNHTHFHDLQGGVLNPCHTNAGVGSIDLIYCYLYSIVHFYLHFDLYGYTSVFISSCLLLIVTIELRRNESNWDHFSSFDTLF